MLERLSRDAKTLPWIWTASFFYALMPSGDVGVLDAQARFSAIVSPKKLTTLVIVGKALVTGLLLSRRKLVIHIDPGSNADTYLANLLCTC